MRRAQIPIGEAPPARREGEDRLCPQLRNRYVHKDQAPTRRQQFVKMPQGGAQITHRMNHIRANDEIKGACLETLFRAWLLEIKDFVFHAGKPGQLLHGAAEKCRGDVTKGVGMQIAFEEWQDMRSQSPRSGADLQDSQAAALWKMTSGFLNGRSDRRQPMAGVKTLTVELVQQLCGSSGKQHLNRILLTTQNGTEFCAVRGAEQALGQMA